MHPMDITSHMETLRNPRSKWNDRITAANAIFQQLEAGSLYANEIKDLFQGDDYPGRLLALQIIATYGDREALAEFRDALRDLVSARLVGSQDEGSLQLRAHALRAFLRLAPDDSRALLQDLLRRSGQNENWDRILVRASVGLSSDCAIELCRAMLGDPKSCHIHRDAVYCLAFFGEFEQLELLRNDLTQREGLLPRYLESVIALGKARDPDGLKELDRLIGDFEQMDRFQKNRLKAVVSQFLREASTRDEDLLACLTRLLEGK